MVLRESEVVQSFTSKPERVKNMRDNSSLATASHTPSHTETKHDLICKTEKTDLRDHFQLLTKSKIINIWYYMKIISVYVRDLYFKCHLHHSQQKLGKACS